MDDFKQESEKRCGPGGFKCRCCGPKRKDRPKHRRAVRRVLKSNIKTEQYTK